MVQGVIPNSSSQPKEAYLLQRSQHLDHLVWQRRTDTGPIYSKTEHILFVRNQMEGRWDVVQHLQIQAIQSVTTSGTLSKKLLRGFYCVFNECSVRQSSILLSNSSTHYFLIFRNIHKGEKIKSRDVQFSRPILTFSNPHSQHTEWFLKLL